MAYKSIARVYNLCFFNICLRGEKVEWRWDMSIAVSSSLVLWTIVIMTGVFLFWGALRLALTTCEADGMTRGLAGVFCLLLLLAGLTAVIMMLNLFAP